MKYELVYYNNDKDKNVIVSDTLKNIDRYIIDNKINNVLELCKNIKQDKNDILDVKIISRDDKHERDILYLSDIDIVGDKDFLGKFYNLFANDTIFKNKVFVEILFPLTRIKGDNVIKYLARDVVNRYPSYNSYYNFYFKYLETKLDNDGKTKFDYSKYRRLGEIYIKYVKTNVNDKSYNFNKINIYKPN